MTLKSKQVTFSNAKLLLIGITAFVMIVCLYGCSRQQNIITTSNMDPYSDRLSILKSQLNMNYANPNAHCELGKYYLAKGMWARAEFHLEAALNCDPGHRNSQAAYIKLFHKKGDLIKAQQYFSKYQRQLISSPDEMVKFAKVLGEEGLDQFALNCFNQALLLNPDSSDANKYLGYFYLYRNNNKLAKRYFTKSFKLNANQPDIAGELGKMGVVIKTSQPMINNSLKPLSN